MIRSRLDMMQLRRSVDLLELMGGDFRRIASSHGGEYAGPCPFCGGDDRCHVQPYAEAGGRWFCRKCTGEPHTSGWRDVFDFVMRRNGCTFVEACAWLQQSSRAFVPPPRPDVRRHRSASPHLRKPQQAEALVNSAAERLLHGADGETGRTYLASRGIALASAAAWRLGVATLWHPQRREHLPAITIPWLNDERVRAVQYRFFSSGLAHGERYAQWSGGERLLCGLHLLRGCSTLMLVEGELNAVSIHQACPAVDVLSWGPQANILRPCVLERLNLIHHSGYRRVLLWADQPVLAERASTALAAYPCFPHCTPVQPPAGLDANALLCSGSLAEFLLSLVA
jgi:hypothetical protein